MIVRIKRTLQVQERRPALKKRGVGSPGRPAAADRPEWTIGLDLRDRWSQSCVLDAEGEVAEAGRVATAGKGLSGLGGGLGHEVVVAHAQQVRLMADSSRKDGRMDARRLALLSPVRHRRAEAQPDLTLVRGRAALVEARTALINSARGLAKSHGEGVCEEIRFLTRGPLGEGR